MKSLKNPLNKDLGQVASFRYAYNYFSEKIFPITQQPKKKKESSQPTFHPHVTIANRDISKDQFHEAWQIFKDKNYSASFEQNTFYLLKHDGSKWHVLKELAF